MARSPIGESRPMPRALLALQPVLRFVLGIPRPLRPTYLDPVYIEEIRCYNAPEWIGETRFVSGGRHVPERAVVGIARDKLDPRICDDAVSHLRGGVLQMTFVTKDWDFL